MPKAQVYKLSAIKDCGWTALARIALPDGTIAQQADISTITCTVMDDDGTANSPGSLTVANVIFDTLQTSDGRWDGDSTGFNFAYEVPATSFPAANFTRVEFTFTPAAGAVFKLIYEGVVLTSYD